MTRWKLILGVVLLACIAAAIPPATLYMMSRNRAVQAEQRHLTEYAQWTVLRTHITMQDATDALRKMEQQPFHDCSPQQITAMRFNMMSHRTVGEMGYYENGFLACTSWGRTNSPIPRLAVDYTTSDGIGVHMHLQPQVNHGKVVVGLEHGNYNVLVDPAFMVDVLVDNEMSLALANGKGQVIATLNAPDPALVRQAINTAGPGAHGDMLFSSYRTPDWIAVSIERRIYTDAGFRRQRTYLLPLGLVLAGLIFLSVLWALRRRLSPLAELEIAVRKREFVPHYQPIVDVNTGRCIGAEALARWIRPDGTMIAPNMFIPLAEQSGLICLITDIIMQRVVEEMQDLLRDEAKCHISINLCAHDAETGRPLAPLLDLLRRRGITPDRIWLETTERVFIHPDRARSVLAAARRKGHCIAVDDFGTGYSSLSVLHSLPLDILKIDKSFIDAIGTDSASARVIPYIIDMANELHLFIIAEGVEREEQAEYCRQHGVTYAQGWLYGKAMERKEFLRYFEANRAEHPGPARSTDSRKNISSVS